MSAALFIVAMLVVAWPLARMASAPATRKTRSKDTERRRRYVARNPHEVNNGDIRRMLADEDIDAVEIDLAMSRATEIGVKPFTMYAWLRNLDAPSLVTSLQADLTQEDLIAHISNGTMPDLEDLEVLAAINGMEVAEGPSAEDRRRARRSMWSRQGFRRGKNGAETPVTYVSAAEGLEPEMFTTPSSVPDENDSEQVPAAELTVHEPGDWAMEGGRPVTLETLGFFEATASPAPEPERRLDEGDAQAA